MPQASVSSLCLQPELKELLISCVKTRPAIWDVTHQHYGDGAARRRAYTEIAAILSDHNNSYYKPAEIQVEWKKMRDVFNRTLKKVMASNGKCDISWRYFHDIKFIASPEQVAFLRQKSSELSDGNPAVDLYGIRHFMGTSTRTNSDDNLSTFKDNDESLDMKTLDLDWIAARCVEQEKDNASTKHDGSSSYDEPLTATQIDDCDQIDDENLSTLNRKRSQLRTSVTNGVKAKQPKTSLNETDTYDAFGAFVASQLRAVSRRNRFAGANLQRAILEICLKSELEC